MGYDIGWDREKTWQEKDLKKQLKKLKNKMKVFDNKKNNVCFCGGKTKYIYEFKELGKIIYRCKKHKVEA